MSLVISFLDSCIFHCIGSVSWYLADGGGGGGGTDVSMIRDQKKHIPSLKHECAYDCYNNKQRKQARVRVIRTYVLEDCKSFDDTGRNNDLELRMASRIEKKISKWFTIMQSRVLERRRNVEQCICASAGFSLSRLKL